MVISEAKNELTTKTKPKQQDADRKCEQGTVQKLRIEGAQKRATFKTVRFEEEFFFEEDEEEDLSLASI